MGYVKMLNVSKWYDICSSIPQVFPLNDLYIGYGCRRGSSPSRPTSWIRPWSDSNTVRYYMTVFTISSPQFFWGSLLRLENALTKSIPHKYIYIFFWHKSITICPQLLCYWPSPLAVLPGPLLLTVVFFSICTGRKTPIRKCCIYACIIPPVLCHKQKTLHPCIIPNCKVI